MDVSNSTFFLTVKDHSVSKESFDLYYNAPLDLVFTHPQPDAENLPKYYESEDYISHTDHSRSLFEKAYQLFKRFAISSKLNLLSREQQGKGQLLDIGAGTGDFLHAAMRNGWQATGFEPNEKARGIAIQKGINFAAATADLPSGSFDAITMWHVLEHIPDLEAQIVELKRLLKPGATLLVAVPNFKSLDAKSYGAFWAAFDVPRHLWHFSRQSIKILFEREGLQLKKVLPMPFDAFYVSLLSEKYKTGKMNLVRAFFTGLRSNIKGGRTGEYSSHIYVLKSQKSA